MTTRPMEPGSTSGHRTIAVLGATGMVGSRVVEEAVARGHHVLALSRKPAGDSPLVTTVAVDANDRHALREALEGPAGPSGVPGAPGPKAVLPRTAIPDAAIPDDVSVFPDSAVPDAVVVTVRTLPADADFLVGVTRTVLDFAAARGVRVLVVGGAGALRSPADPVLRAMDDPRYVPSGYRAVAAAGIAQLRACQGHTGADWVYLSPPAELGPGDRTGRYRRGTDTLLTTADGRSWISAEDLAVAVVDELRDPGPDRHFTVVHRE
jgi:uncharacterized protein